MMIISKSNRAVITEDDKWWWYWFGDFPRERRGFSEHKKVTGRVTGCVEVI